MIGVYIVISTRSGLCAMTFPTTQICSRCRDGHDALNREVIKTAEIMMSYGAALEDLREARALARRRQEFPAPEDDRPQGRSILPIPPTNRRLTQIRRIHTR